MVEDAAAAEGMSWHLSNFGVCSMNQAVVFLDRSIGSFADISC